MMSKRWASPFSRSTSKGVTFMIGPQLSLRFEILLMSCTHFFSSSPFSVKTALCTFLLLHLVQQPFTRSFDLPYFCWSKSTGSTSGFHTPFLYSVGFGFGFTTLTFVSFTPPPFTFCFLIAARSLEASESSSTSSLYLFLPILALAG